MTAPEIWLVLTVGFDPRGYFLGDENLFELAIICILIIFTIDREITQCLCYTAAAVGT